MKNKKLQKSKILNFNFKNLSNNILDYPFVEISKWLDLASGLTLVGQIQVGQVLKN
jgi:hypothetical protein